MSKRFLSSSRLYLAVAFLLSLLNSSKCYESDLANYERYYVLAKEVSFRDYLLWHQKDPFFYSVFYFASVNGVGFRLFLFSFTFAFYYLILITAKRYDKVIDSSILLLSLFIPQIFLSIGHLMRQSIAIAIGLYGLSQIKALRSYTIMILGSLAHFSSLSFVLFSVLFKKHFKALFILGLIFVVLLYQIPIFSYALKRLSGGFENWTNDNLFFWFFLFFNLVAVLWTKKRTAISSFTFFTILAILLAKVMGQGGEATERLSPFIIMASPFVISVFIRGKTLKIITFLAGLSVFILFIIRSPFSFFCFS